MALAFEEVRFSLSQGLPEAVAAGSEAGGSPPEQTLKGSRGSCACCKGLVSGVVSYRGMI